MNDAEVSALKPGDLVEINQRRSAIRPKQLVTAEFRGRIGNEAIILLEAERFTIACECLEPHTTAPGTLYVCQNAAKCGHAALCTIAKPHEFQPEGCFRGMASDRRGRIKGSICVPYVACERKNIPDSDVELAKEAASIHKTRIWLSDEQYEVGKLLLRLADRLERLIR